MDGTIKQSRRFAELERLSDDYFRYHLASVMDETRDYLARKQGEEMKEYSTSLGGVLSMMASSAQPLNDPYQLLKVTGEWNSKTTEDYVEMCKEKIAASEDIQHDLAYMAGQWRDAVVKEIGRERYDELSEQLGGDLAYAYMDYRLEQQMIDKLVKDRMPKSSADYIIRKAAESSLFGLPQMLNRSPLVLFFMAVLLGILCGLCPLEVHENHCRIVEYHCHEEKEYYLSVLHGCCNMMLDEIAELFSGNGRICSPSLIPRLSRRSLRSVVPV